MIRAPQHSDLYSEDGQKEGLEFLCCPACSGSLKFNGAELTCGDCAKAFPISGSIPQLFVPTNLAGAKPDVTDEIRRFYEATPFPNYDECDSIGALMEKARRRVFAKTLDDQIPFGARILECGCGTGQLTNFLSVGNRTAVGTDICLNSLNLAQRFKEENRLARAHFIQMNLFRPCFRQGAFDLVISNGVLHHTSDPAMGFQSIAKLVKPKGYIIIGLYHKWGRLTTDIRRGIFGVTGDRLRFLDLRMTEEIGDARKTAWFMDQYKNPHESKHTIGEVLGWLKDAGFSFVTSIPRLSLFDRYGNSQRLFTREEPTPWLHRTVIELSMSLTGQRDGGLFIVIAQNAR